MDSLHRTWTLDGVRNMICRLEGHLAPHWHVGLTGGVLRKGESTKDVDLIFYPHDTSQQIPDEHLFDKLVEFGWTCMARREEVLAAWQKKGSRDMKMVTVWLTQNGMRVDVFLLR